MMTRREQIKSAYRLAGGLAGFYDGMMTYSTLAGKAICRVVWNMDGEKNLRYLEKALSGIPADFSGKLLEVPVGTGVLTMPVYRELPDAEISCLDYSEKMMASAREKAQQAGIGNINFLQGDVGGAHGLLRLQEIGRRPFTKRLNLIYWPQREDRSHGKQPLFRAHRERKGI